MNEKQQQLTFDKGITNVPSDALCSDNTLEESIGMIYDNGEHRVIQNPVVYMNQFSDCSEMPRFVYVHKTTKDVYIGYFPSNNKITFGEKNGSTYTHSDVFEDDSQTAFLYTSSTKITSIGKTVIIINDSGMHYFLWNAQNNDYDYIGNKIPEPKIRFWLEGGTGKFEFPSDGAPGLKYWYDYYFGFDGDYELPYTVVNNGSSVGIIADRNRNREPVIETDADEKYNDLVIGLYSKNKKAICQKKAFCEPFFVRYALRLYDDSLYYISNPILMFPSVTRNTYFMYANSTERLLSFTKFCYLHYDLSVNGDLEKFSDIVKDIDIFVSDGMSIYDTAVQQPLITLYGRDDTPSVEPKPIFDGVYHKLREEQGDTEDRHSNYRSVKPTKVMHTIPIPGMGEVIDGYRIECLQRKDPVEIKKNIKEQSIFYKICSIGLRASSGSTADLIETHTLENLTTQEQIDADDYFSRCRLYPDTIFTYNSRLNLANASRGFFEGYDFFMPFVVPISGGINTGGTYDFYVTIGTDQGDFTVKHTHEATQNEDHINGVFFYYPDSRAKHVVIMKITPEREICIMNQDLKEHGGLNGAFFFRGLPGIDVATEPTDTLLTPVPTYNNNATEQLPNYVITSEVDNPIVFKAEGYNKVGTGKILGMSTTTMALSQDQFGRTDLIVFSEMGVWGMQVDGTGLFQSIHPFTRDVCNNPKSITQVDGAVFFSSERGLMMVTDKGVSCVSEQLSGLETNFTGEIAMGNFRNYLKDCFMAYDYRDSLLWIFNNSRTHVVDSQTVPFNTDYCYIYSIKTGTFGKYHFTNAVANVVNNYPDYLLQSDSNIYSLLERANINLDNTNYSGLMISRPMKLENGLALKSLMQVLHIKQLSSGATMTLKIYASNNLNNWVELHSLRGTPWKYYRFRFDFTNAKATDRFAGTMLITQERRTNKLR